MIYFPLPMCHSKLSLQLGHQVMPRVLLSLSTLGMCNFERGRRQRLIKSFCDAWYRSCNHQVSFYSRPFSLPKMAKQNSANSGATGKATQILALKPHSNANSQLTPELHQSDSLQSIYSSHHCLGRAGLTVKCVVKQGQLSSLWCELCREYFPNESALRSHVLL